MAIFLSFRKSIVRFSALFIVMVALMLPLAWLSLYHPHQAQTISAIIAQHTTIFLLLRWSLIAAFFLSWRALITTFGKKKGWSVEKIEFWQKQRLKLTGWLVLFEVVLCENLLLKIVQLLEMP